ncbi:MAG: zinc-binding dehydrogenase [Bacteroidaceae bacterium]|nr:zinc-binding dehydrogenase [Bacteroidaceae bacterium]
MKAIVLEKCCKAEELHVSEVPIPKVKPGWMLVRVHAAGLNHSEALLRQFEADSDHIQTPIIPGIECVGEVADASDTHFHVGEKVIALMGGMGRSFNGSYAEYALLPAHHVFRVETDLDWVSLAAVPETYYTAYGSLFESLYLKKGEVLLVRGATSTVGQAAIQLAKAVGATVIAAARRESSFEKLQAIGADYCIIDDEHLCEKEWPVRPNKVLELIGLKTLRDSLLTVPVLVMCAIRACLAMCLHSMALTLSNTSLMEFSCRASTATSPRVRPLMRCSVLSVGLAFTHCILKYLTLMRLLRHILCWKKAVRVARSSSNYSNLC